jgi:hypothetical protein
MALFGITDSLASAPKYIARKALFDSAASSVVSAANDTINLLPSNTGFNTGDAVYYSINGGTAIGGLTDATTYFVRVTGAGLITLYDTYANATASSGTTGLVGISAVGVGTQSLQLTGAANPFGDHTYNGSALIFVDAAEARATETRAKGIKNAGWWLYRTWTNADESVAKRAECLIALNDASADLDPDTTGDREDTIAADLVITIGTQPANTSVTAPATATFTVAATVNSTELGSVLTYQWQKAESTANTVYADITGATSASYTTGATAVTAGAGATNGDKYRVVITAGTSGVQLTSNAVTLTVS